MLFTRSATLLEACVLSALSGGDTYGYELSSRLNGVQEISESTLYPVLRRLQKENLLSTYDSAVNGRNRRYYSLTDGGREKLSEYVSAWEKYKTAIDRALYGREQ